MAKLFYGSVINNSVRVQYYRTGDEKPAVVLLHALADNGLCWSRLALLLEPEFDVVMIDARGHGLSDGPLSGCSLDDHVSDVAAVIRETGVYKPVVIGHSLGANTAAALAVAFPKLVSGIVLEDPLWWASASPEQAGSAWQEVCTNRVQLEALKKQSLDELLAAGRGMHPAWEEDDLFQWAKAKQQTRPVAMDVEAILSASWMEIAAQISIPTLIITADVERGSVITPQVAEDARRLIRKCKNIHIPGAGHDIRRDKFELYWDAVYAFLSDWGVRDAKPKHTFLSWPFRKKIS